MFAPPAIIQTEVFARVPDKLHCSRPSAWVAARQYGKLGSFLEGPSFDRAGNLYCTDIPYGRIFRVSPKGEFEVVAEYDGEPNGLKIHAFEITSTRAIENKRILLVDDVITTGATLEACGQQLLNAGCKNLSIACIAEAQ